MLDSVVVINEVVHEAKVKRRPSIIFKVDFEKAYDSVDWGFLEYMMNRMGFCAKWIAWIMGCLGSASISVLVNGSPTGEFQMEKGLRQGDPLAPFLFLIVAEGLTGLFSNAVSLGKFKGIAVGKEGDLVVSLLQFADDTVFVGEASIQNLVVLKSVLRCFELVSGLKVNFHKSKLASIATSPGVVQQFASFLNCKVMAIPFVYLGIPVGGRANCVKTWDPVIKKLRGRLSKWKQKMISFGGRICLIKSVLSALPLFFFIFFQNSKGCGEGVC